MQLIEYSNFLIRRTRKTVTARYQNVTDRLDRSSTVVSAGILNVTKFVLRSEVVSQFPKTFLSVRLLRCLSFDATFSMHSFDTVWRFVSSFWREYRGQVDEFRMISSDRQNVAFFSLLFFPFFFNKAKQTDRFARKLQKIRPDNVCIFQINRKPGEYQWFPCSSFRIFVFIIRIER